jgi:hypothetical protein
MQRLEKSCCTSIGWPYEAFERPGSSEACQPPDRPWPQSTPRFPLFSAHPWWYIYVPSAWISSPLRGCQHHRNGGISPAHNALTEAAMAKIRHLAITTEDPEKTAAFYMQAFDRRR